MTTAWHRIDRTALTRPVVATRGWPFVHALDASGLFDWLTQHEGALTQAANAAELRRRLPAEVLLRARAHVERWPAAGLAVRNAHRSARPQGTMPFGP